MSKIARVTLLQALSYRGGAPMAVWLLHRISGLGILLFVSMHIVAAFFLFAVQGATGAMAESITLFYESLPVQIFMLFAVIYHAINGARIVVLDMWPSLMHFNREALWLQWALFLPMFLLPAVLMVLGHGS